MKHALIQKYEAEKMNPNIPDFGAGDTIVVQVRVKEGSRERLQAFKGDVIAIKNRGLNSAVTVRKRSHGVGVERVFQLHSPLIASITVERRAKVRRAKPYYVRERTGKSERFKERIRRKATQKAALDKVSEASAVDAAQETPKDAPSEEAIDAGGEQSPEPRP